MSAPADSLRMETRIAPGIVVSYYAAPPAGHPHRDDYEQKVAPAGRALAAALREQAIAEEQADAA